MKKVWTVWCEGYRATGNKSGAFYFGEWYGDTFREAVETMVESSFEDEDKTLVNLDGLTYWGCRFFDNEVDARKSFG